MSDVINVLQKPIFDSTIVKKEYHSYSPYLQTFNNNDEIRIPIQNQDLLLLPSQSYIHIEGSISMLENKPFQNVRLRNNCMAYLFEEIRYEINGLEIDRTRNLGVSTSMKNYVSLNMNGTNSLSNAGWFDGSISHLNNPNFNFCLPLKLLLGFAEDFNKIIINAKHELILLRAKNDDNIAYSTDADVKVSVNIKNITWKIPHIQLSDFAKLEMYKILKMAKPLQIPFRSWDCHVNPALFEGSNHLWNVKLSLQNEKPRFILMSFQGEYERKNNNFTHCDLTNIKVYLNSESYPYEDLGLDFANHKYAVLYDMYSRFREYYYYQESRPILSRSTFKDFAPIIVIDVSHQNELIKNGPIDIRIEFQTKTNVPANTSAYCLILHDRVIEYTPMTNMIRKVI